MAMRDQWTELYGPGHGLMGPAMTRPSSSLADSTTVTTSSGNNYVGTVNSPGSPAGIEGRVGKSAKRRSRASRRAPVTLLNTDTSNFRAMVQQFTGIPSGPYSSGGLSSNVGGVGGPAGINFGLDFNASLRPSGGVMAFGQTQMQPQQYQRPSFQEQTYSSQVQPQQQQYQYGGNMFAPEEFNNNGNNDIFSHGFNNDGIFLDGTAGRMMSKTTSVVNSRSDEYFG
ncbi:hypothetical protein LUZ60_017292 [Juncus effusus]|nr:hypothetical protein LUZ60_017292 [Juncus effusus]